MRSKVYRNLVDSEIDVDALMVLYILIMFCHSIFGWYWR